MQAIGYVDVAGVGYVLPDGRELLADVAKERGFIRGQLDTPEEVSS